MAKTVPVEERAHPGAIPFGDIKERGCSDT